MPSPTDHSPAPAPGSLEAPFPFVSAGQAASYIGDMVGSLRLIALRSDLTELARQLDVVEAESRRLQQNHGPRAQHGAKAG